MILSARQRRQLLADSSQGPFRRLVVAVDSRAACSEGLALAGLGTAAAVSGSRRYRNIRIDGHFSAHGMPNARSALHMTLRVQFLRGDDIGLLRDVSSRDGLFRRVRSAPETDSTGFGLPSKQHWPQRGRGVGDAPGPTTGRSPRESALAAREQSSRAGLLSVGFSTRSTRDGSGVPAPQHFTT